jgi:hypothetical protein
VSQFGDWFSDKSLLDQSQLALSGNLFVGLRNPSYPATRALTFANGAENEIAFGTHCYADNQANWNVPPGSGTHLVDVSPGWVGGGPPAAYDHDRGIGDCGADHAGLLATNLPLRWSKLSVENSAGPECGDGVDDDGDGAVDYPTDPDCDDPSDPSELARCSDGSDNDGDGLVDRGDPGCPNGDGALEDPECDDGQDNDHDGLVDFADPSCSREWPYSEGGPACGLGNTLWLALLPAMWLWRRRVTALSRSAHGSSTGFRARIRSRRRTAPNEASSSTRRGFLTSRGHRYRHGQ